MDSERSMNGYFQDFINPSSKQLPSCTPTTCFDCNICLEFAADPVVTFCGHLYCWPCIFRWLHLDASPRHCPVCKSAVSESSLVPLYGRGLNSKPHHRDTSGIPDRPTDHRNFDFPGFAAVHPPPLPPTQGDNMHQNYHIYNSSRVNHLGVLHSTAGSLLGEIAFSIILWAFGIRQHLHSNSNQSPAASGSHELTVESWLHHLWFFLICCALLFLMFI